MSITTQNPQADADCLQEPCSGILRLISPRERDLGGFSVRRVLPHAEQTMIGPWIFFDHMGPVQFHAGQGIDVRPHPHIHLATVTYLFAGEILHRDSLGNVQSIKPGDINLMVAGKGIVHSERSPTQLRNQSHALEGLQLWLALPSDQQNTDPAFFHYASSAIPTPRINDIPVRIMMGSAYGSTSPVKCYAPTLYLEITLKPKQKIKLPNHISERAVYVVKGSVDIKHVNIPTHTLAVLKPQASITLSAQEEATVAVIGGEPVGKRFIWWNFISDNMKNIEQAKLDWTMGRFPKVPGDEVDYIPLPSQA